MSADLPDNRLWIQRVPPKPPAPPRPPKKSSLKAKRALKRERHSASAKPAASSSKAPRPSKSRQSIKREYTPEEQEPKKEEEPVSGTRRRTQVAFYGNPTPTAQALKRGGSNVDTPASSKSTRSTRAHPLEVKAESWTMAETPVRGGAKGKGKAETPASLPRGTRVSRRLRDTEDEWQQVPPEWLAGGAASGSGRASRSKANGTAQKKTAANGDDESELSDLTDEEEHEAKVRASGIDSVSVSPLKPTSDAMDVDPVSVFAATRANHQAHSFSHRQMTNRPPRRSCLTRTQKRMSHQHPAMRRMLTFNQVPKLPPHRASLPIPRMKSRRQKKRRRTPRSKLKMPIPRWRTMTPMPKMMSHLRSKRQTIYPRGSSNGKLYVLHPAVLT